MLRNLIFMGFAGITMLLSACAGSRVQTLTKATVEALELVRKEAQRAIQLTAEKIRSNEVDPDIGKEIITNLEGAKKKMDEQMIQAADLEKSGNREDMLRFAEKSTLIIQTTLTDIKSLNDLYDVTTFSQFETATFFPTGGYIIPSEKMEEAKASIEPVVQRIIKFFGEHPNQRFVAVIVCTGFADETPILRESTLYPNLLNKMDKTNPTRQDLNAKLSELRAKNIASLLVDLVKVNEGLIPNPRLINYDIKFLGKGEALPYPDKIKDYKPFDRRRRMVSLIWSVLPGSLYAKDIQNNAIGQNHD